MNSTYVDATSQFFTPVLQTMLVLVFLFACVVCIFCMCMLAERAAIHHHRNVIHRALDFDVPVGCDLNEPPINRHDADAFDDDAITLVDDGVDSI